MSAESAAARGRVLIVDDDERARRVLSEVLGAAGHRCTQAGTGGEARAHLGAGGYDLVLLDLWLPDEAGVDLLRHIAAEHPATAAMVVTAIDDATAAHAALDAGAYGYVVKPCQANEIVIGVAAALRRRELEVDAALRRRTAEREPAPVPAAVAAVASNGNGGALLAPATRADRAGTGGGPRPGHDRAAALLASTPAVILGFDLALRCTYANDAAVARTGFSRAELAGVGWRATIHPDDLVAFDTWLAGDIRNGVLSAHDHRGLTRDGDIGWRRARVALTRGPDGSPDGYVCVSEDITRARAAADELHRRARTDDLTGLANRVALFERLAELSAVDPLGRQLGGRGLAVVFVDLDRFKNINDSHGHSVGDAVLAKVGRRMADVVAGAGTVARLGGDEFVIVVEDVVSPRAVIRLTERVLSALRVPVMIDGAEFVLSGAAGLAFADGGARADGEGLSGVIGDADIALRRAKELGGDGYELFDEQMRRDLSGRLEMEAGLRRAVERDEFVLHYQPEYQADGHLSGFEALIRWDHPTLGWVGPTEFVPIAEECGLVVAMGRWALFEACEQAARWAALRGPGQPLMVSVNLSAIQLRSRNLVETVAAALARSRLDGECLCLEITESVIMEDAATVVPILDGLRALGVRLAIDDFGTGYSSLGYLSELPVDFIKIDRRFVEGIGVRSPSQNIVKAVIQLAHALDLQVVAEGIEQPGQLDWLRRHGCDLMQGFHLGRPGPPVRYDAIVQGSAASPRPADHVPGGNRLRAV